jgi:hypothetical protein
LPTIPGEEPHVRTEHAAGDEIPQGPEKGVYP